MVNMSLAQLRQYYVLYSIRKEIKSTYCCVSWVLDLIELCHLIKHYSSCHILAAVLRTGKGVEVFWLNSYCTPHLHTCGSDAE